MKRNIFFAGMAASVMLFSCASSETAEEKEERLDESTVEQNAEAEAVSGSFAVDVASSSIGWLGKKQFVAEEKHNGTVALSSGSLEVEDSKLVGGSFVVDMTSIADLDLAENAEMKGKLEGHLKADDFFGVEAFPEASFTITEVGEKTVKGTLTVRGIEQEAEVTNVAVTVAAEEVSATGTLIFDRSKFEVKYGSSSFVDGLGDNAISNDIELTISIKATKA